MGETVWGASSRMPGVPVPRDDLDGAVCAHSGERGMFVVDEVQIVGWRDPDQERARLGRSVGVRAADQTGASMQVDSPVRADAADRPLGVVGHVDVSFAVDGDARREVELGLVRGAAVASRSGAAIPGESREHGPGPRYGRRSVRPEDEDCGECSDDGERGRYERERETPTRGRLLKTEGGPRRGDELAARRRSPRGLF